MALDGASSDGATCSYELDGDEGVTCRIRQLGLNAGFLSSGFFLLIVKVKARALVS